MKKLLTSLAAFTAMTAAASAADLPRRAAPPPVFTPVPVFTWTGFYAGFNAGYGFGVDDTGARPVVGVDGRTGLVRPGQTAVIAFGGNDRSDGFVGGGQIGYNYQFTPGSGVVIGIEADAQYVDFGRDRNRFSVAPGSSPFLAGTQIFNPNGLSGLDFFGTVRGRLGYAFDRTLVYGTGGFAYGSGQDDQNFAGNRFRDSFRTGWAAGGGVEYALPTDSFLNFFRSSAVTLKVEGLYVNFDGNNSRYGFANANGVIVTATPLTAAGPISPSTILNNTARRDVDFAVIRAGLNYKFGSY